MSEIGPIIGLTGGIATGKSTVSTMLTQLGCRVIDADIVAREIVRPGEPGLEAIRARFGDRVIAQDGTLERAALADVVFSDDAARADLNAITHPRIAMRMMEHAQRAAEEGFAWVLYDAALIVENDLHRALAGLVVVACDPATQIARLMARDGLDRAQAVARIASQMPIAKKVAAADWVIRNDGSLEQTRRNVAQVFRQLCEQFGPPRTEQ